MSEHGDCPACSGRGFFQATERVSCAACCGTGWKQYRIEEKK